MFKRKYDRRWICVRNGSLIVTKGKTTRITKVVRTEFCEISSLLQNRPGTDAEFFVGLKMNGKPTMYFGSSNKAVVEKLMGLIKESVDTSVLDSQPVQSAPAGFTACKIACPEDMVRFFLGGNGI